MYPPYLSTTDYPPPIQVFLDLCATGKTKTKQSKKTSQSRIYSPRISSLVYLPKNWTKTF